MLLKRNSKVLHETFGPGVVREVVGQTVAVEFFGEVIDVLSNELELEVEIPAAVAVGPPARKNLLFRQAFEAINLGVVPPHPEELIALSIGGGAIAERIIGWLGTAQKDGVCKVFFGDYGAGKSHHLRMCQAVALSNGWVVSSVELDPKNADAAKPHLVYRAIISGLRFPARVEGPQCGSFFDFIGEARRFWQQAGQAPYLKSSPWYRATFEALRRYPHGDEREYLDACDWLAGEPVQYANVKAFCRDRSGTFPPSMPRSRETAEVYVLHLVILHHMFRALGFKGLLIILDEAEHIRPYSALRRGRATNLFDLLARCAHKPLLNVPDPFPNDHGHELPRFWAEGPHFGLLVGLTEGDTFSDPLLPLRDACVFLHTKEDIERLVSPSPEHYQHWCSEFFRRCNVAFPAATAPISDETSRRRLARVLTDAYKKQSATERTLRLWTKLATLVLSICFVGEVGSVDEIANVVSKCAREAAGETLPWE